MIERILAIGIILFAALVPLALVAGLIVHGIALAKRLGTPLEYDIPDAAVYWAGNKLPGADGESDTLDKGAIQPE